MTEEQKKLVEFHKKFGLTVKNEPGLSTTKDLELRKNLIIEEAIEFAIACKEESLTDIIDALCDLLYVTYGAAVTFGVDLEPCFNEVHRSNMTKVWPDGTVKRRPEDGKIIKPDTYSPASLSKIILEQMRKGEKS